MKIWKYKDEKEYRQHQYKANAEKIDRIWVQDFDIEYIAISMRSKAIDVKSVLCHGTRNGAEQRYFKKFFPNLKEVIGTEIAPTAKDFEDTIRHDFQKVHDQLIGRFDIVYSNSLDHSRNPLETLKIWGNQLKNNHRSVMWLDVVFNHHVNSSSASDPIEWDSQEEFEALALEAKLFPIFRIIRTYKSEADNAYVNHYLYGFKQTEEMLK